MYVYFCDMGNTSGFELFHDFKIANFICESALIIFSFSSVLNNIWLLLVVQITELTSTFPFLQDIFVALYYSLPFPSTHHC